MPSQPDDRTQVNAVIRVTRPVRETPAWRPRWSAALLVILAVALCAPQSGRAQATLIADADPAAPVVRYRVNESGGRISITHLSGDSTAVELIRLVLLETAAAIRRGDFNRVRFVHGNLPAIRVLADRSQRIRCTYHPTAKGGELLLLSEDDVVVRAIHQLLATEPPIVRL
jgi:hypothetical protein